MMPVTIFPMVTDDDDDDETSREFVQTKFQMMSKTNRADTTGKRFEISPKGKTVNTC